MNKGAVATKFSATIINNDDFELFPQFFTIDFFN